MFGLAPVDSRASPSSAAHSELRLWNNFKRFKDFYLNVKAKIWR